MIGVVRLRTQSGQHVAIRTAEGDYAIVRVYGSGLFLNDLVRGDLINPGPKSLQRIFGERIEVYLEGCRLREDAARELMASINEHLAAKSATHVGKS